MQAQELIQQYTQIFHTYRSGAEEVALQRAYEFARKTLADGLGVLDVLRIHQKVVRNVIADVKTMEDVSQSMLAGQHLLAESLSPFHITQRGFQDTIDALNRRTTELAKTNKILELEMAERRKAEHALRLAHEQLERRIVERTAELNRTNETLRREVVERKQTEQHLQRLLQEKEVLLKEIHHRVKNNLQVVSSLLALQSDYIKDTEALAVFKNSQNRIQCMALVHEQLYQSAHLVKIDMAEYLNSLVENIRASYSNSKEIQVQVFAARVSLGIDTALPCALIVNELVSNAFEHAFPDGRGEVRIELLSQNNTRYVLAVEDTGKGFPDGFEIEQVDSLGLRLVRALTEQLRGKLQLQRSKGAFVVVQFFDLGKKPDAASLEAAQRVTRELNQLPSDGMGAAQRWRTRAPEATTPR